MSLGAFEPHQRPLISYEAGEFRHNGERCPVRMTREKMRVACSEVTVRALRELLRQHEIQFGKQEEHVVQ